MTGQFYDKVTRKFGTFQGVPRPLTTYPQGNPEEMFEQKLFELSGKDKVALDLGCGDGRFTLRMAGYFQEIVGIDSSVERLKLAQAEQQLQEQTNVRFEQQDASQTSFAGNIIDLVYSRRGPTPYQECYRITKPKGYFLTISIGEKDAWELKQTFGRGQGYGAWKTSALEQAEERLQRVGFEVVYRQDVLCEQLPHCRAEQGIEAICAGGQQDEQCPKQEHLSCHCSSGRIDKLRQEGVKEERRFGVEQVYQEASGEQLRETLGSRYRCLLALFPSQEGTHAQVDQVGSPQIFHDAKGES